MALPKLEVGIGVIDGANATFFTPTPYDSGSVRYYLNGQLLQLDCLTEIDAATGEVLLVEIPRTGDVVQLFYIDAIGNGAPGPEELICPLEGVLRDDNEVIGLLFNETYLVALLDPAPIVDGILSDEILMVATVHEELQIEGMLVECDA